MYDRLVYFSVDEKKKEKIVDTIREFLKDKIKLAYIFGSFLKRERIRDVDIAVYPASFNEVLNLGSKLELKLHMPVDILPLNALSPAFRLNVMLYGLPVIFDEVMHNYLVSQAFSEIQDFKIALKSLEADSKIK